MHLVPGGGKGARKMNCRIWQKAHRSYFPWPWRRASSSDDGAANEPSAEFWVAEAGLDPKKYGKESLRRRLSTY
jgi:hypothetical protein